MLIRCWWISYWRTQQNATAANQVVREEHLGMQEQDKVNTNTWRKLWQKICGKMILV